MGVNKDTIAAPTTPPGQGAVGIIRISGPQAAAIGKRLLPQLPPPRQARLSPFIDPDNNETMDRGLVIWFPAPDSFTGEDVLEFHAHGSPVLLDMLLRCICAQGARVAEPGEFSLRAFLNGKIDLLQAEAIADLIGSRSEAAARAASRNLQGGFSAHVNALAQLLTALRTRLEATIDFPEDLSAEELSKSRAEIGGDLQTLQQQLHDLLCSSHQGKVLNDGLRLVILGPPNAGKSTLLNTLAEEDIAIVSALPGTTRDLLRQAISVDGVAVELSDTAGLRAQGDPVEMEGIRRATDAAAQADHLLIVLEGDDTAEHSPAALLQMVAPADKPYTVIRSKCDVSNLQPGNQTDQSIVLSAHTGHGMADLRQRLRQITRDFNLDDSSIILARRRHLDALSRVQAALSRAQTTLAEGSGEELAAEDLREAQQHLGEITGQLSTEELLGSIFSSFCIGK